MEDVQILMLPAAPVARVPSSLHGPRAVVCSPRSHRGSKDGFRRPAVAPEPAEDCSFHRAENPPW